MANVVTVSGPYAKTSWVNGVTAANQTRMNNEETQASVGLSGFNGDLLTAFIETGMVCTKDGSVATQLDVSAGTAYAKMTDGTLGQITATASTAGQFTTSTPSTTYYLFLLNNGTYQWGTSSSQPTNSLWLCQATTDGSGNILVVTDKRTTITTLLSGAASPVSLPMLYTDKGLIASDGLGTVAGQSPATPAAPSLATAVSAGTTYRTQLLASSPIRYYRLDETSGTVATDLGSQAQNGTYSAATLNQTGLLNGDTDAAAAFNGTTSGVSLPTTSLPTGNAAWSIACVVKPTNSTNGANGVVAAIGNPGTNGAAGYIAQASAGGWIVGTWGGGSHDSTAQDASVAGHTYFLAATYDGASNLRLYVADLTLGTTTPAVYGPFNVGTLALTAGHANIGLAHTTVDGFWFAGVIDEVAVFSSALSAGALNTLYTIAYGGPGANALPGVGTYQYAVTYATATSETSSSTPASIATTSNNQKVALTAIPLGPNGTTKRNLYRTIMNGSALLLLAALSDNTTTTYTDQIADSALGAAIASHPSAGGDIWKNAAGTTVAQIYGDGFASFAGFGIAGLATAGYGAAFLMAISKQQAIANATNTTICSLTVPAGATRWVRCAMMFWIGAGNTNNGTITTLINCTDPIFGATSTNFAQYFGATSVGPSTVLTKGNKIRCMDMTMEVTAGSTITLQYQNAAAGTIADKVTASIELLA